MRRLTVVVPVLNGEEEIPEFLSRFGPVKVKLFEMGILAELLVVDDGSTDRTDDLLCARHSAGEVSRYIRLSRNFGAIEASTLGIQRADGDALSIFAVDLQDPPELLIEMAACWLQGEELVICPRKPGRSDPFFSKIFSKISTYGLRLVYGGILPSDGFDVFLLDRKHWNLLESTKRHINRSLLLAWSGIPYKAVPYHRPRRVSGRSRWSFPAKAQLFFDSVIGFSAAPFRSLLAAGLVFSILGLLFGSYVIVSALAGSQSVPGYASTIAIISLFSSLNLAISGAIAEYTWRSFEELSGRPKAIVLKDSADA